MTPTNPSGVQRVQTLHSAENFVILARDIGISCQSKMDSGNQKGPLFIMVRIDGQGGLEALSRVRGDSKGAHAQGARRCTIDKVMHLHKHHGAHGQTSGGVTIQDDTGDLRVRHVFACLVPQGGQN